MSQARYLVTGGAGFIGSAVVWALNARGHTDIVVTDFLEDGKTWSGVVPLVAHREEKSRNLAGLKFTEFVEADIFRTKLLKTPDAFGRFDAVFHLGACSSTTENNQAYLADNNFAYTQDLARWALSRNMRFIYASSAATYGDGSAGMDDKDDNIARLKPMNRYGESKQLFDLYAQREGWLSRLVGLKYFNVYGPNEDHKGDMRSLVNKAFHQIKAAGRMQLFKSHRPDYQDGEQQRDFLYVKDAVAMTLHFAFDNPKAAGLYNLGSGEANTWLTLAKAIFAALGKAPAIDFIDMPLVLRDKYQYFTCADIAKLRMAGYTQPVTPLNDAVRDYVQNYLVPDAKLGS